MNEQLSPQEQAIIDRHNVRMARYELTKAAHKLRDKKDLVLNTMNWCMQHLEIDHTHRDYDDHDVCRKYISFKTKQLQQSFKSGHYQSIIDALQGYHDFINTLTQSQNYRVMAAWERYHTAIYTTYHDDKTTMDANRLDVAFHGYLQEILAMRDAEMRIIEKQLQRSQKDLQPPQQGQSPQM